MQVRFKEYLRIYGISIVISAASLLLTAFFFPLTATQSLVFCVLGVALSAWDSGLKSAITTIAFTTLGADFFFYPPIHSLLLSQLSSAIQLIGFVFVGVMISIIIGKPKETGEIKVIKRKEKEYLDLLAQMQRENANYKKEIKARDEFLSIASHELKTPLSSMLLQLQAALHNIRNVSLANFSVEKLLKMLQSAEQQTKRLSKMINDLLNVSLITTGRLELEPEEFDLAELLKDVVDRFGERAKREGVHIRFTSDGKVIGKWDKLRIEQAVNNLLSNALKYGNGKPVDVLVKKHNSTGQFSVADHGIGIPEEAKDRIFERFERAVNNHDYKGLGVGLYITYQIVKAHRGTIKVNSHPNNGSTFTVDLPIHLQEKN